MARNVEVGILIKAKDSAADGFDSAKKAAKSMGSGIDEAASRAKGALKSLGAAVVVLNQGLEIGKKIFNTLKFAIGETVGATLAQRSAADQGRRDWEAYGKQLENIKALIGDFMLPIILGIADAFKPLIESTGTWLKQNRELAGSNLVEWLAGVAKTLTSVVGVAALLVTKAWYGWSTAINYVESALMGATATALKWGAAINRAVGDNKLADAQEHFAKATQAASDIALGAAARQIKAMEDQEGTIDDLVLKIQTGIGDAALAAHKRYQDAVRKSAAGDAAWASQQSAWLDEAMARLNARANAERAAAEASAKVTTAAVQEGVRAQFQAYRDGLERRNADIAVYDAQLATREDKRMEDRKAKINELRASVEQVANSIGGAIIDSFSGVKNLEEGFKSLGKRAIAMIRDIAITTITAAAAKAVAESIAAYASIPFAGIALGLAAAATVGGVILSQLGTFHTGGQIPGPYGREQFARVEGGEVVVRKELAGAAISAGLASGSSSGYVPSNGGGPSIVRVETAWPVRTTTDLVHTHFVGPAINRARRRGER